MTAEGSETPGPVMPETTPQKMVRQPPVPTTADGDTAPARRRGLLLPSGFASIRDILSFGAGVGIIAHEVWWSDRVEVAILAVGATLAGLPVVFGADERKGKGGGAKE